MSGKVYLVGAGPGDPGLLTLKGRECLEKAEVVIYDFLADTGLLGFTRPDAELICVGKHGAGGLRTEQGKINRLLVEKAREGKVVVRLKGGDPFLFGRGGEEAEELARRGIEFEVVPGVTAGVAVPAYAGIPLTHRDYSSSVAFVTGYEYPDKEEPAVRWSELARGAGTLVVFMTARQLRANMERLVAGGVDPETPVAVIRWGTRAAQQTLVGTVATIAHLAEERGLQPPALAVVGGVVRLRERLQWFEKKPLFGRRIAVTRARVQAGGFAALLEEMGAEVVYAPAIELQPPDSWEPLDRALRALGGFHWLIFTSANGVAFFSRRLDELGGDIRDLQGVRIAAIGPETARAVRQLHLRVDAVPQEYRAERVLDVLGDVRGRRILLPRAAGAREVLPEELRRRGAEVVEVAAYRNTAPRRDSEQVRQRLAAGEIHLLTFTSSSTVRNFAALFSPEELDRWVRPVPVACIGPVTAEAARALGLQVVVQPAEYTVRSFAAAIGEFFGRARSGMAR